MSILNPPFCLEVLYTNIAQGTMNNLYTATLVSTGGQEYSEGTYDCTNIQINMWTSNSTNGYAYIITEISKTWILRCGFQMIV